MYGRDQVYRKRTIHRRERAVKSRRRRKKPGLGTLDNCSMTMVNTDTMYSTSSKPMSINSQ